MCVCVCVCVCSVVCISLQPHGLKPIVMASIVHEIVQPRMEGVCLFLLQGIFPTQELNPYILCLWYCRQILYH